MIVNKHTLLELAPIKDMLKTKESFMGVSHGLTECGYDIRLKQTMTFHKDGIYCHQDRKWHEGNFILGSSIEEFDVPNFLMGVVMNKSTWARLGIDASATTNIEPGWKGHLTIELFFKGNRPVTIYAGQGICQVMFHEVLHHNQYVGKYNNQPDRPVAAILRDI